MLRLFFRFETALMVGFSRSSKFGRIGIENFLPVARARSSDPKVFVRIDLEIDNNQQGLGRLVGKARKRNDCLS